MKELSTQLFNKTIMKLIKIGRDPNSEIILRSPYVSSNHAELILLDNGDILLVDNSSNGTTLNGIRLTPGVEVKVRRGDQIMFADTPLDWNIVPFERIPQNAKRIINIGSYNKNNIVINGNRVSRFHANLREMKDGKWFICDTSTNGTMVNGMTIPKNRLVPVTYKDKIVCGGVPIENPIPKPAFKWWIAVLGVVAAACVAVGIFFGFSGGGSLLPLSPQQINDKYGSSVVFLIGSYHFEVECGSLDISKLPDPDDPSRPMFSKFVISGEYIIPYDEKEDNSMLYTATGFLVGTDGYVATNLHVAKPWLSTKLDYSTNGETILSLAGDHYRNKLNKLVAKGYTDAIQYISQIKIIGVSDGTSVVPNGDYFDSANALSCHEVISSEDENVDLAIFKIRSASFKSTMRSYVPIKSIHKNTPSQGKKVVSMGFPYGVGLLDDIEKTQIQANMHIGQVTRNDNAHTFGFDGATAAGASGSPVFDDHGRLIGVLCAGLSNTQGFNLAVRSEDLAKLLEKANITK